MKARLEAQEKRAKQQEVAYRDALLDRLRVLPKFRGFAPDVDPFSDAGKAALDKWAEQNPELCSAAPVAAQPDVDLSRMTSRDKLREQGKIGGLFYDERSFKQGLDEIAAEASKWRVQ